MQTNQQSCNKLALLIIKEFNSIDFSLNRQFFDYLKICNLFSYIDFYLFKDRGRCSDFSLFMNVKLAQILQVEIIAREIDYLSFQYCYPICELFLLVLSQQLQYRNLKTKMIVQFPSFYLPDRSKKSYYNTNLLIKSQQNNKRGSLANVLGSSSSFLIL